MGISHPYHRNYRAIKSSANSGHSGWAYIADPEYARNAEHYVRAFVLIQKELEAIFEYVEPADECRDAYSYKIHAAFMRTCIEVEANFKAILSENQFTPPKRGSINMAHYRKVDVTHHLSSYEVMLPIWNGLGGTFKPFGPWKPLRGKTGTDVVGLPWYQAYNESKHDRYQQFKKANLANLTVAVAGLLVLISAQFSSHTFDAGPVLLATSDNFLPMKPATGSLFRIQYPDDWLEDEIYDFDWNVLRAQSNRFRKIDFDSIPS